MALGTTGAELQRTLELQEPNFVFSDEAAVPRLDTLTLIVGNYSSAMTVIIVITNEKRSVRSDPQFRSKLNKRVFVQKALTVDLQIITIL